MQCISILCLLFTGCAFGLSKHHVKTVEQTEDCTYRVLWPKLDRSMSVFTGVGAASTAFLGSLAYSNPEYRDASFILFGVSALTIVMSISHYRSSVYGYEQVKRCCQFREKNGTLPPEQNARCVRNPVFKLRVRCGRRAWLHERYATSHLLRWREYKTVSS